MRYLFATFVISLGLILAITQSALAEKQFESGHIESPSQYEMLFENERVLVLRMVLKPGESDSFHYHNNETVYFQQGSKLKIETKGGEIIEADVPDGHVMWHEAWTHRVTNLGDKTAIAIIVEEK